MSADDLLTIDQAAQCLRDGEIIAYPTEAVYGLGCDPACKTAVHRVLALKRRPASAGLILIADRLDRFDSFTRPISSAERERVMSVWPGPVTWLFPKADAVPDWLAGEHATIALRLTAHPVCRALCASFGGAIVSTSANPRSAVPARRPAEVHHYFGSALCGVVEGELGSDSQPSEIRDLASGKIVRKG